MMRVHAPALVLLTSVACSALVETTVDNPRPFDPPAAFVEWWLEMESCSGLEGPIERVSWFVADGLTTNRKLVLGRWDPPHDITILAGLTEDRSLVQHEILHDLLGGDPDHRDPAWEACGVEGRGN